LSVTIAAHLDHLYGLSDAVVRSITIPRVTAHVTVGGRDYYLKVRDESPHVAVAYIEAQSKSGLLASWVVPTLRGSQAGTFLDRFAYLVEQVPGVPVEEEGTGGMREAGRHLARMHQLQLSASTVGPSLAFLESRPDLCGHRGLAKCWIHGDFKLAHLFHSQEGIASIDFDEVCYAERVHDLYFFCACPDLEVRRTPTFAGQQAFVDGYRSAIDLTEAEERLIPELLEMANATRLDCVEEWYRRKVVVPEAVATTVGESLAAAARLNGTGVVR